MEGSENKEGKVIETLIVKLKGVVRAIPVDEVGKLVVGKESEPVGYTRTGKPKRKEQKGGVIDTKS